MGAASSSDRGEGVPPSPQQPLMRRDVQEATARENYNRLAKCYDCWSSWEKPYLDHALKLVDLTHTRNEFVLEIGCGTGYCLEQICLAGNSVTGIDISEGMVQKSIARLQRTIENPEAYNIMCASASQLPFPINAFDCVLVCFTLELFPVETIITVLGQIENVLKPGGRLVAVSMSTDDSTDQCRCCGCPMKTYRGCHSCCPNVVDCRPIPLLTLISNHAPELTPIDVEILPFYGLSVESVVCKRKKR